MDYIVYCHRNIKNGKRYIGITKQTPQKRWKNGNGYAAQHFSRAIDKYGWDNFEHDILEEGLTREQACSFEKFYINKYDTANPRYGYNATLGGDGGGMKGKHHTHEAIEKIRQARKKNGFTEEHKKHISESKSGVKHHMARPVYQYSVDGVFIRRWDYMNEAAKSLGTSRGAICAVCRGYQKRAAGFIWSYADRGEYH